MAKYTDDATGRCDLLVNCAGVASAGSLMSTDEAEWQKLISLDLMSVIWGSKAFIPLLKKTATPTVHAAVINIASFAGIALMPGMMSYNVTKAGVIAFSESLRCELFNSNIHVGVSCPSFFKTNLLETMSGVDGTTKDRINRWMENSGITAADVAADIAAAVNNKEFMILSHKETKKMYRLSRWFPNYFRKQKTKMKMF